MYALLLVAALSAAGPEVEVRTLAGETIAGPLVALDATSVTVETADGPQSLELAKLMAVTPKQPPEPRVETPAVWVELLDGSQLVARQYAVKGRRATVMLLDGRTVEVSTEHVMHVPVPSS